MSYFSCSNAITAVQFLRSRYKPETKQYNGWVLFEKLLRIRLSEMSEHKDAVGDWADRVWRNKLKKMPSIKAATWRPGNSSIERG